VAAHSHYRREPAFEDRSKISKIATVLCRMNYDDDNPIPANVLPEGFYRTDSFTNIPLGYLQDRQERKEERPVSARRRE
jgi:hypothetical protein